jgi:hypothetical protein
MHQMQDQRDGRDNQQQVNQATGDMQSDPKKEPNADQGEEQNQEEEITQYPHVTLLNV